MGTFVLMNKFKNSQTTLYGHYYYFCILGDVALNYHPTKFGSNCKTQCGYITTEMDNYLHNVLDVFHISNSMARMQEKYLHVESSS